MYSISGSPSTALRSVRSVTRRTNSSASPTLTQARMSTRSLYSHSGLRTMRLEHLETNWLWSGYPEDSNAVVTPGILEGDSINIYVTAADGTENTYTLYFPMSTLQSAQTPSANDVLLKHMGGLDFAVASLRKNVSIAVYSLNGQVIFTSKINESSQNDAVISVKADGSEQLMDIHNATTHFTLPEANKIFFYAFLENEERRIASGKLVVAQ